MIIDAVPAIGAPIARTGFPRIGRQPANHCCCLAMLTVLDDSGVLLDGGGVEVSNAKPLIYNTGRGSLDDLDTLDSIG